MDNTENLFFQVSVKGLFFDKQGKLMMVQEKDGVWELPGGRVQKGENLTETLKRECLEEMGLECEVLEKQPSVVYSTIDRKGLPRLMVCYKVRFKSLEFTPTEECVDIKFWSKDEIRELKKLPQTEKLPDYL